MTMGELAMAAQWEPVRLFDGEYFVYRGGSANKAREGTGTYTQKGDKPSSGEGGGGGSQKADSGSSPHKTSWAAMEGPVYVCDYLGYKTLNKPATSIAGLQGTVKDLYLQFRRSLQQGAPSKKSSFKITPGGLIVSLHEGGGSLEMIFDINCINLIQAVRFAIAKGTEKKPKAVFVPIDDSRVNVDKAAFSLEKPFHFLVQASHQPLLVCVLRRPKGVKALDCHVFGMDSPESVLYVQSCVQQLMTPGGPTAVDAAFNRSSTRGDFIRTEFGDYNVYRGGQGPQGPQGQHKFELKDEYFRGRGDGGGGGGGFPPPLDTGPGPRGGAQPSPRETYPAESSERPRFGWSYDKPQSGEDFRRISGHYGGDAGRPVSAELRPGHPPPADSRQGNLYYADNRAGGQVQPDRRSGEGADERGGGFHGGPSYNQGYRRADYERAEVVHVRERSGDSGDSRVTGLNRKISGGSDHNREGVRGMEPQDSRFGPVSPRSEAPPRVMNKPVSPIRAAAGPPFSPTSPTGGHAPLAPRVSADSPRSPTSPYSPPGPAAGGPLFNEGPAFSLSNRESRADEVEQEAPAHGKPVAKVPPHLKGVKVLPSDFLAVKLKPKQQRADSEESEHGYDNHKNILAQYKQLQLQEQDSHEGFTSFEDRDLDTPSKSRTYTSNWNDDGRSPAEPGSGYDPQYRRHAAGEDERRYIEQFSDQDTMQTRPPGRYEDLPAAGKSRQGSGYGEDAGGGKWRSKMAYDMAPGQGDYAPRGGDGGMSAPSSAANDEKQMGRKKDAEIASMFTNFSLQGRQDNYDADRNNFEQSLGYLP